MASTQALTAFLKSKFVETSLLNRLKIAYRPLICPFDELLNTINSTDEVFDIGCGSGQFCLLVSHFCQVKRLGGVDISQTLINNAQQLFADSPTTSTSFSCYDGQTFPVNFSSYNRFFLIDVLHHIPQAQQMVFLQSIYNQMPKGGRFILKDIDGKSPFVFFNKIHDLLLAGEIGNELSYDHALATLKSIGFKIVTTSQKRLYVYPHYTIVAEK